LKVIQKTNHVERDLVVGAGVVRLAAVPVAAQVEREHAVVARQVGQNAGVDPGALDGAGEAVHQHHRRPGAEVDIPDPHPARVEVPVLRQRSTVDPEQ
jgi:hypothetical protein